MNIERNVLYWSVPLILWLVHYADNGSIQILGRGINHNETLTRDRSSARAKTRGRK
jgi:hypothetical protein